MTKMRSAYLGGPMRHIAFWNFPAFTQAAGELRRAGWTIWSPAEHDAEMHTDEPGWEPPADGAPRDFDLPACLDWDYQRIAESDCVIFLPGWERSTGCHWEMVVGFSLSKPLYEYRGWLDVAGYHGPNLVGIVPPAVVREPTKCGLRYGPEVAAPAWPPTADEYRGADVPRTVPAESVGDELRAWLEPDALSGEHRVVDSITGGEKGQKEARFDLIPPDVLWELAEHYGRGCRKYADRNWEKGYAWGLSIGALLRHLTQWLDGEDYDEETGSHHLIAVAWHAFCLRWFTKHHAGTDDRSFTANATRTEGDLT